jgi:multimeric flavodoxin WrbA
MKLFVINGSPRGEKSNTKILQERFLRGYKSIKENDEIVFCNLNQTSLHKENAVVFEDSDIVFLGYPLYADSMPGVVKAFIEELKPATKTKKILFLVQSGFPESIHCEATANYMEKLAKRLKLDSAGVIVKPGAEGIQTMPPQMTKKLFNNLEKLGVIFAKTGCLDPVTLRKIRGVRKYSFLMLPVYFVMKLTGLIDFHWNTILKKNKAFEKRFDQPYLK